MNAKTAVNAESYPFQPKIKGLGPGAYASMGPYY
jgi:hypothetical protein